MPVDYDPELIRTLEAIGDAGYGEEWRRLTAQLGDRFGRAAIDALVAWVRDDLRLGPPSSGIDSRDRSDAVLNALIPLGRRWPDWLFDAIDGPTEEFFADDSLAFVVRDFDDPRAVEYLLRVAERHEDASLALSELVDRGDPRVVPILVRNLGSDDGWVRSAAAYRLADLGDPRAEAALLEVAKHEPIDHLRQYLLDRAAQLRHEATDPPG
jgi:hypothetical protein